MKPLKPENPPVMFSLDDCKAGDPFPSVPKWLIDIIAESNEWKIIQGISATKKLDTVKNDIIPF
jgi:hypothetical protein